MQESNHKKPRSEQQFVALTHGAGQLSMVEHALCPLAVKQGAVGLIHESQYRYSDKDGQRRTAHVRVICPLGLTPSDEFFLWGLLALTLSQASPAAEFVATPHYCLRQLGIIDQHGRRGGRQYQQFAQSLERLSAVSYLNDGFYDPIRREHRRLGFGFLSFSLPLSSTSSRAWRILWDQLFFEMMTSVGGCLRFDLEIYRQLDAASRRLFLFSCKFFWRRSTMPPMELRHLGQHVLGFAPSLATRDLKIKIRRCVRRLAELNVIELPTDGKEVCKNRRGTETVQLLRGKHFQRGNRASNAQQFVESYDSNSNHAELGSVLKILS